VSQQHSALGSLASSVVLGRLIGGIRWIGRFAVWAALAASLFAQKPAPVASVTVQTGMADTFQLTLGGMFGNGPAWQNKLTATLSNTLRTGDSLSFYGWNTVDTRRHSNNWQVGLGYKAQVLKTEHHAFSVGSGLQHWRFPSVKTGADDVLIPGNLVYQAKAGRVGITLTEDSWTLLSSPLPVGSLLHSQVWLQHNVLRRRNVAVAFRHGPAHTYSWGFYGANGHRVFRYQTMLAIAFKHIAIEGGIRKQWGLQDGIPHNRYWQFAITRTLTFRTPG
jgi:hypothetical protein